MTKIPKSMDNQKEDSDNLGVVLSSINSRKSNYKSQKPILEKRRRDRINSSLDELKSLLLAIKQRDPLRYARLEKADILEMVVKHLKDIKKRRQAMIAAMEPVLFRSFKMGYMNCTRATIDFIGDIDSPAERKQQIIDHISNECMKTLQTHRRPASFHQHHEIVFGNVNPPDHFVPFPLLSTSFDGEIEWPSLEERLGFSPISKSNFLLPEIKPLPELFSTDISSTTTSSSLLKTAEPTARISVFNRGSATADSSLESPSTSGTSGMCTDGTPQPSIFISDDDNNADGDDEEEGKLIIDDHNNNINGAAAWRPWM